MWNPNIKAIHITKLVQMIFSTWFGYFEYVGYLLHVITLIVLSYCFDLIAINFNWSTLQWSIVQWEISSMKLCKPLFILFFCILIPDCLSVSWHNWLTLNEGNCTYLLWNFPTLFPSKLSLCFYAPSKLSLKFYLSSNLSYFKKYVFLFLFKTVPRMPYPPSFLGPCLNNHSLLHFFSHLFLYLLSPRPIHFIKFPPS